MTLWKAHRWPTGGRRHYRIFFDEHFDFDIAHPRNFLGIFEEAKAKSLLPNWGKTAITWRTAYPNRFIRMENHPRFLLKEATKEEFEEWKGGLA